MTQKKDEPFNLKESLAREEEAQDWDEHLGMKIRSYSEGIAKAKAVADTEEVMRLANLRQEVTRVFQKGYLYANESAVGREVLDQVRERRQMIEEHIAEFMKKKLD